MSDVPKFVRQRAAQQAPGDHPEANLLAAFAEGRLTKGEREHVLAHLGASGACRDVIALALPETAAALPAPAAPERHWLRWPMLRWGGAVAAVMVVAAAVLIVKPNRTSRSPAEQGEVAQSAEKTTAPKLPEASPGASGPTRTDEVRAGNARAKDFGPNAMAKENFTAKAEKKQGAGDIAAFRDTPQRRDLDQVAKNNEGAQSQGRTESAEARSQGYADSAKVQSQVVAAPPPVASTRSGSGPMAGLTVGQSGQQQAKVQQSLEAMNDQSVQAEPQSRPAAEQRATQQLRPAPQATESVEVTGAAPAMTVRKAAPTPMAKAMMVAAIPRWRVSAEGAVERSTDGGRTWLSLRVAAAPVIFRSVSAIDQDVWAGGAGGALYHSTDDGRTWTRVTVKAFDMILATDIARVEFTDAQHGGVTTTTGVTWVTSDAGTTWSVRARPPS